MTSLRVPLLSVRNLAKTFPVGGGFFPSRTRQVHALAGISFDVARGETLGLVGESGCGKSTASRCVLRLVEPSAGSVVFDGIDVLGLDRTSLRRLRRRMQIVFQDSSGALDSRMSARRLVEEPLVVHGLRDAAERRRRVDEILDRIGLRADLAGQRPRELSGGQRQRIGLARALVLEPELMVLDEPISALDVSVQAQVLNLLRDLQRQLGLTFIFVVHDLSVAEYFCDRIAVLYLGTVVELAEARDLFRSPRHPYTVSLIAAVPTLQKTGRKRIILEGEISALADAPARGCPFRTRCPVGRDRPVCAEVAPALAGDAQHAVACHFPGELAA